MKKNVFILLAILALTLVSCKKDNDNDNDNPGSTNYMEYDGETYNLTNGYIIKYGIYKKVDVYEFDIYMYSGMNIIDPDSVMGSGNIVGFCIYSENPEIDPGTYNFSLNYGEPFTTCYGHFQLEWEPGWAWIDINVGSISISIGNNNEFDISFDCVCDNGNPIKGRYKGIPVFYDFEWKRLATN